MAWSNLPDEQRRRLEKLFELVKRGVGGEAENAQVMLLRLLEKCGLTMADLEAIEEPDFHQFAFNGHYGRELLLQIVRRLQNHNDVHCGRLKGWKPDEEKMMIMLTRAQATEAAVTYSVYWPALNKEIESCFSAFLHVNDVFSEVSKKAGGKDRDRNEEEAEDTMRMWKKALLMSPTPVHKQITGGGCG